jgi:hypothetical protein
MVPRGYGVRRTTGTGWPRRVGPEREQRQQAPLLGWAQVQDSPLVMDLDGPQHEDVHDGSVGRRNSAGSRCIRGTAPCSGR